MNTIDNILERWNAPMPAFFKPIYQASLVLLSLALGITFVHDQLVQQGLTIPGWFTITSGVAGVVGTLLTKLTVDWNAKRAQDRARAALSNVRPLQKDVQRPLHSPWWLSGLFVIGSAGPYIGWAVLAALIGWLLNWPATALCYHMLRSLQARRQRLVGYEPEGVKEARRLAIAQATIRETKALQLFGNKLKGKGYTNAEDLAEIRGVLTGAGI